MSSDHQKNSLGRIVLSIFQDSQIIIKSLVTFTKVRFSSSLKTLGYATGFVFTAFLLLNVALLFSLIALAYGLIQIGLAGWISFLLVAAIMIALAVIFIVLAIRSFSKVKGIGGASRIGNETKNYLKENVVKPEKSAGWNSL